MVARNLAIAFPDKSIKERKSIQKNFQSHFTDLFLQAVKNLTISADEAKRRINFKNVDLLENAYSNGRSIMVYTAHIGNWEWLAFMPLLTKYQMVSFYQQQSNAYFNELMILIRTRFGNTCVESGNGFRALHAMKEQERLTLTFVIGDQRPKAEASSGIVKFFGLNTPFLTGTDRMAKKLNHDIYYLKMIRLKRAYYEVEFIPLDKESPTSITQQFAGLLEENIKQDPGSYLWTHKRWKGQIEY